MMRRLLLCLGVALSGLLATACSILPESTSEQVYRLPAAPQKVLDAQAGRDAGFTLRVLTPYSSRILAGMRILVRPPEGNSLNVYKGVRWSDPAPVMLRDRLVDVLRTDGRLEAVSHDANHWTADLLLGGDLNHFEVDYVDAAPVVHIQWDALLIEPLGGHILASRRFRVRQAAAAGEVDAVVQAFGRATDTLADEMRGWILSEGRKLATRGKK